MVSIMMHKIKEIKLEKGMAGKSCSWQAIDIIDDEGSTVTLFISIQEFLKFLKQAQEVKEDE